jgi:BirA family biotin operon repressor/biotin-[acetyl-CoA-carboxylase] ligase
MDITSLKAQLAGLPVPEIRYFNTLGSTNDEALAWAQHGAPDGALVVADTQTAGRGRFNRLWITPPDVALAFSLLLKPNPDEMAHLPLFSPLAGLALSLAVEELYHLSPEIKYPNDVLLRQRKTAGILVEAVWLGSELQAIVVGVGVNVRLGSAPPPAESLFPATTLEDESGVQLAREELLAGFLRHFTTWRPRLGTSPFFTAWQDRLAFYRRQVTITQTGKESLTGILIGIDGQGALRLQSPDGHEARVTGGDLSLRPSKTPNP